MNVPTKVVDMPAGNQFRTVLYDAAMAVISGQLAPGDRLTLSDVEERFGVSRTLARDVVKSLETVGLVVAKRRTGIEVLPPSEWKVLDPQVISWRLESEARAAQMASLTEVREAIEPMAAALAARRRTETQAHELVRLARELVELGSAGMGISSRYLDADVAFHSLLLEASGNEMMAAMSGMVSEVLKGRVSHGLMPAHPHSEALEDHVRIAEAILHSDAHEAEEMSRRQLKVVETELAVPGR